MFKDIETLRETIRKFKLQRLEKKIVSLAKPAISMVTTAVDEQNLPLGTSKLGGLPDLPVGYSWPYHGAKPLTFIGQFRLSELASHDTANILPSHGIIYYFYDTDEILGGEYRDVWKVVYIADKHPPLIRTPHPTYQATYRLIDALPVHRIEYVARLSLPIIFLRDQADFDINFLQPAGDKTDPAHQHENDRYFQLLEAAYPYPQHHWLGHPYRIQHYVEWDVIMSREGIRPEIIGNHEYRYTHEQIAHVQLEMANWQFLFQISSDDSLGLEWGDTGTLYICIPKTSLTVRQFEDCWTIMQCS
jgi:uncharacterized protein YwqG